MQVRDGDNLLELTATDLEPSGSPAAGDAKFAVRVRVTAGEAAFSADSWAWVCADALAAFTDQLAALHAGSTDAATLASLSPGELELAIRPVGSARRMAVSGQVGRWRSGASGKPYWSAVSFGFEFCPGYLPGMVTQLGRNRTGAG